MGAHGQWRDGCIHAVLHWRCVGCAYTLVDDDLDIINGDDELVRGMHGPAIRSLQHLFHWLAIFISTQQQAQRRHGARYGPVPAAIAVGAAAVSRGSALSLLSYLL
jgi:hypothetical protein